MVNLHKKIPFICSLLFLVVLLLFGQCTNDHSKKPPKDVKGWGKTHWGMTQKELLKIFEKEGAHKELMPTGSVSIQIDTFPIHGQIFGVYLFLYKERLSGITIMSKFPKKDELPNWQNWQYEIIGINDELYDGIELEMTEKYGPPSQRKKLSDPFTEIRCIWLFPSTEIELIYHKSPNFPDRNYISIGYKDRSYVKGKL